MRTLLDGIADAIVARGPVRQDTLLALRLLKQALESGGTFGCQVITVVPADARKTIDVSFATLNMPIRGLNPVPQVR